MPRHAPELECSAEEKASLVAITKSRIGEARVVERGERVFGELSSDSVRKLHEWGKRMLGEG